MKCFKLNFDDIVYFLLFWFFKYLFILFCSHWNSVNNMFDIKLWNPEVWDLIIVLSLKYCLREITLFLCASKWSNIRVPFLCTYIKIHRSFFIITNFSTIISYLHWWFKPLCMKNFTQYDLHFFPFSNDLPWFNNFPRFEGGEQIFFCKNLWCSIQMRLTLGQGICCWEGKTILNNNCIL